VPGSTYRITSGGTTTRCPSWSTGCAQVPGAFDAQTVYLHENGHVAGLGHSSDPSAVMYPSYQTARCALAQDDMTGLAALY
jgi:hypothetical protein